MEKQDAELLVALGGAPKGSSAKGGMEHDDIMSAASDDIIDAIKEHSSTALEDALHRFVMACMNEDAKEDDEEEAPESER